MRLATPDQTHTVAPSTTLLHHRPVRLRAAGCCESRGSTPRSCASRRGRGWDSGKRPPMGTWAGTQLSHCGAQPPDLLPSARAARLATRRCSRWRRSQSALQLIVCAARPTRPLRANCRVPMAMRRRRVYGSARKECIRLLSPPLERLLPTKPPPCRRPPQQRRQRLFHHPEAACCHRSTCRQRASTRCHL